MDNKTCKYKDGLKTSDIIAALAFVVSLFSLGITFWQANIQNNQHVSQQLEYQPTFEVNTTYMNTDNDSIYDTEVLTIRNIGKPATAIGAIQCVTFIKVEEWYYQDRQILYVPVMDYFCSHGNKPGLIDEVLTDISFNNNLEYNRFYQECKNNSLTLNKYFCEIVNFVIIPYDDIYEKHHRVFFKNGEKCSQEFYDEIVKLSEIDFGHEWFRMSELKLDDLKKYCKIDKTRKMAR
jgi:hypothetical protein